MFRHGILSFSEQNSIEVWKQMDELFYHVANEYLYFQILDIHAVQALGGINEMMVHIKKMYMLLLRLRQFFKWCQVSMVICRPQAFSDRMCISLHSPFDCMNPNCLWGTGTAAILNLSCN